MISSCQEDFSGALPALWGHLPDCGPYSLQPLLIGDLYAGSVWQGWGRDLLALKDSFVGKDGFPNCGEHASGFITTEGLFLGLTWETVGTASLLARSLL